MTQHDLDSIRERLKAAERRRDVESLAFIAGGLLGLIERERDHSARDRRICDDD